MIIHAHSTARAQDWNSAGPLRTVRASFQLPARSQIHPVRRRVGTSPAACSAPARHTGPAVIRPTLLFAGLLILVAAAVTSPPADLSAAGLVTLGLLVVMALWWFTETLPVTATALLPFVVLPATGAARLNEVAASYMSPVIFLVLGGALLALAMEKSGLHRRLAVAVLTRAGTAPGRLVLAFMAATAFVSMWVSNTATTLIMMPIAVSVLAAVLPAAAQRSAGERHFALTLVLGVAYAASIGGLGTLIGSPTNAVAAGVLERSLGVKIDFLHWLALGLPLVLVAIPLAWWVLTRIAYPFALPPVDRSRLLAAIGPQSRWSPAERRLLPVLLSAAVAWVALPLLRIPALAGVEDSSVAILAALALFVIPAGRTAVVAAAPDPAAARTGEKGMDSSSERKTDASRFPPIERPALAAHVGLPDELRQGPLSDPEPAGAPTGTLLEWRDTTRAPWDVLFLFGGGLALAEAITRTGLGTWLGAWIGGAATLPMPLFVVLVTLVVIVVTEFASNVAAAASFIPVVAGVTVALGLDPLVLTLPAALAAGWGFMMPAGTPPNAIAYASGYVTVPLMIRAGIWIDLLGLLVIPAVVALAVALFF
ncbi:MAG: SLC13/DASS family transporter [Gammaproteobacteria bacterium]|nr:SLC13/DASS family transporter [Gammaproteobacteria bacterium]